MRRDELLGRLDGIFNDCVTLAKRKSKDYSSENDALENFHEYGINGVIIRMNDKFTRLKNLVNGREPATKDETILDTLMDIINYSGIAIVLKEEEDGR